jgi:hypothetical protein
MYFFMVTIMTTLSSVKLTSDANFRHCKYKAVEKETLNIISIKQSEVYDVRVVVFKFAYKFNFLT